MVTLTELDVLARETGVPLLELDVLTGRLGLTAADVRILDGAGAFRTADRRRWVAIAASVGVPVATVQLASVLGSGTLAAVVNRHPARGASRLGSEPTGVSA